MDAAVSLSPYDLASGIERAWAAYLQREQRPQTPHDYVYASGWRVCDRRMVYELTVPDRLPPWPPEVLAKFRRGDDRERDLLADLQRIGRDAEPPFRVIGQQERFSLKDHKSRVAIVGKVDARVEVNGTRAPLEVKAWSSMMVDRIETFSDLFDNPWTRSGAHQLLAYLYGAGEPYGFLLLDRSGIPKLLPVELESNLDRVEDFLVRAERALDHVEHGTLPDFLQGEPDECQRCPWYGHECNPPLSADVPQILTTPGLEAALERREELKAAGKEFNELDDQIKRWLRGVEHGVVGHFHLRGKWGKQSRLDVPDDIKKQYTKVDPKGRFTLEIVRM